MNKIVRNIECKNLKDLINNISYNGTLYNVFKDQKYVYRGLSSDKYALIPNALRIGGDLYTYTKHRTGLEKETSEFEQIYLEYKMINNFFCRCDYNGLNIPTAKRLRSDMFINEGPSTRWKKGKWIPNDFLEIAGLAQHYGVPTRLLDWSQDIYVALFFAISKALDNTDDHIVLWALNIGILNRIKGGNPLKIIIPQYSNNPNLSAQKGLFTLWQIDMPIEKNGHSSPFTMPDIRQNLVDRTPLDELIKEKFKDDIGPLLYKIVIPKSEVNETYGYLKSIGYDSSRLLPGYSNIMNCIKEDFLFEFKSNL